MPVGPGLGVPDARKDQNAALRTAHPGERTNAKRDGSPPLAAAIVSRSPQRLTTGECLSFAANPRENGAVVRCSAAWLWRKPLIAWPDDALPPPPNRGGVLAPRLRGDFGEGSGRPD